MLRQVFVFKGSRQLYSFQLGKIAGVEAFNVILKKIQAEACGEGRNHKDAGSYDFYKYRASFLVAPEQGLLFLLVTDLSDKDEDIRVQLKFCRQEFLHVFGALLGQEIDPATLDIFSATVGQVYKTMSPKISLVGFSGVGKTTITRLIKAQEIPMEHVPTITGDISTIQVGKLQFSLWDFAGQEHFSFLWNKFVRGSDAVLIITDSTVENVDRSRFFVELARQEAPHAHVAAIGNKQDQPGALPIPEIERLLDGTHAYSMVAIDPGNREKMIRVIADVLDISPEISPLLKNLLERDQKVTAVEAALLRNDFRLTCQLFRDLSNVCLDLGDDSLAQEFHHKAEKIEDIILHSRDNPPNARPDELSSPPAMAGPELSLVPVPPLPKEADLDPTARKKHVEDSLINLKISVANIDKYILDLEMLALMEQCPEGECQQKKQEALRIKKGLEKQISEGQELLQSIFMTGGV